MNTHLPMLPQVQPAIPLHNGRHQPEIIYAPPSRQPHHTQLYHGYQNSYHMPSSQHYPQQHPPQWYQYQQMPVPLTRSYQQYPHIMSTPYQIPQNPSPMLSRSHPPQHMPSSSSIRSHHDMLSPSSSNTSLHVPSSRPQSASTPYLAPTVPPTQPPQRMPYYPPLPWYSFTEGTFPPKSSRRRRRKPVPQSPSVPVELPSRRDGPDNTDDNLEAIQTPPLEAAALEIPETVNSSLETPLTSHAPSEDDSTQPTTPSSVIAQAAPRPQLPASVKSPSRTATISLPIVPAIPHISFTSRVAKQASTSIASEALNVQDPSNEEQLSHAVETAAQESEQDTQAISKPDTTSGSPPPKSTPKSWADLVRTKVQSSNKIVNESNGKSKTLSNGVIASKTGSLPEALSSYNVDEANDIKISFLEPRGLVNTGNMCYMNSVLQILVFCIPFYNFLDQMGKQAIHHFKSQTPLLDAMIMFVREFPIIDSAVSVEQLRMRLKDNELEQYGESFIPDFVYEIIRRLPRFSTMRRGHQQDAEEFLGFLLEEMHEECCRAMKSSPPNVVSGASTPTNGLTSPTAESLHSITADDNHWVEVGPKQKAAVTRSSGIAVETPITKIFGGKIRSELRIPGMKNSVTLEPYQPLQLDIGGPNIHNIIDALKGLTRPEKLHGDFNSPRGPGYATTKHVTIETLPKVLILHLKRFQYDNAGGTQKIWKKIGYPLELEIPKEVFPQHKIGSLLAHGGLPRYRLIGIVYHHGRNASGGHYTVDVRRQDSREWIRLDDTVIRRIRSEEVAEGGSEEDPKVISAAFEQNKDDQGQNGNIYDQFSLGVEEPSQTENGWNQVNGMVSGPTSGTKKWSGAVNGNTTPSSSSGKMTPMGRSLMKDNKVAYLLFYQKISV